jgi:hypothetical protein
MQLSFFLPVRPSVCYRLSGTRLPFVCHLVCIVNCPFNCAPTRKYLSPYLSPSGHLSVLTFFYSLVIFVASSFVFLPSWPYRPYSSHLFYYPVSLSVYIPVLRKAICHPFCVDLHLVSIFCPPVLLFMVSTFNNFINKYMIA